MTRTRVPDAFRYTIAAGSAALLAHGTEFARRVGIERLLSAVSIRAIDDRKK